MANLAEAQHWSGEDAESRRIRLVCQARKLLAEEPKAETEAEEQLTTIDLACDNREFMQLLLSLVSHPDGRLEPFIAELVTRLRGVGPGSQPGTLSFTFSSQELEDLERSMTTEDA